MVMTPAGPILEGEHRLRLLNFQNNRIRSISNLQALPSLIFCDLIAVFASLAT